MVRRNGASGRRFKGRLRNGHQIEVAEGPRLGSGIAQPSLDEVLMALERLPPDLAWADVAAMVVPMFVRLRPHAFADAGPPPVVRTHPPGVSVAFGLDLGLAFCADS